MRHLMALNLRCLERNMGHRSHDDGEERRIKAIEGSRIARSPSIFQQVIG